MLRPMVLTSSLLLLAACGSSGPAGGSGGGGSCPNTPFSAVPVPSVFVTFGQRNLFAVDSTSIYSVTADSQILSTPKAGGQDTSIAQGFVYESLSAAGPALVLTAVDNDVVLRVAKDGSSQKTIATQQTGSSGTGQQAVTSDDAHVYWLGEGQLPNIGATPTMGFLRRSDPDGSNVVDLATGLQVPTSIFVGGGFVFWAEQGSFGFHAGAPPDGTVRKVPSGGGAVVTLASSLSSPVVRARRDGFVWYSSGPDLYRVAEAGGAPALMVRSGASADVTASAVYWLENAGQHSLLLRTPIAGGCATPIALVDGATGAPVVDGANVYVMTPSGVTSVMQ